MYLLSLLPFFLLSYFLSQTLEQDDEDGAVDDASPDQPVTAGAEGEDSTVGVGEDPAIAVETEEGDDLAEGGEGDEAISPTPANKAHTIARTVVNSIMPWVTVFLLKEDTDHKGNKSKTVRPMVALALTKLVARLEVIVSLHATPFDILSEKPSYPSPYRYPLTHLSPLSSPIHPLSR